MKRYIYLFLIFIFGFYPGDVQKLYVTLDWFDSEVEGIFPMRTFTGAEYPDEDLPIPFYTRLFMDVNQGSDIKFTVENAVFETMEISPDFLIPEGLPS